jgi:hypothetical protein
MPERIRDVILQQFGNLHFLGGVAHRPKRCPRPVARCRPTSALGSHKSPRNGIAPWCSARSAHRRSADYVIGVDQTLLGCLLPTASASSPSCDRGLLPRNALTRIMGVDRTQHQPKPNRFFNVNVHGLIVRFPLPDAVFAHFSEQFARRTPAQH